MWKRLKAFGAFLVEHATLIGIVLGVVGTGLGYLAIRAGYDIAERSEAFKHGAARLFYADREISTDQTVDVVFAMNFKQAPQSVCKLDLMVANAGDKTLKGLYLTLRYPASIEVPTEFTEVKIVSPRPLQQAASRSVTRIGNFAYVAHALPNIDPRRGMSIFEPFRCNETARSGTTEVTTKDNKQFKVDYLARYSYQVVATVQGEDMIARDHTLNISGVQRGSRDIPLPLMLSAYGERLARRQRSEYSFASYVPRLLVGSTRLTFLVAPDTEVFGVEPETIQVSTDKWETASSELTLFGLGYLFHADREK